MFLVEKLGFVLIVCLFDAALSHLFDIFHWNLTFVLLICEKFFISFKYLKALNSFLAFSLFNRNLFFFFNMFFSCLFNFISFSDRSSFSWRLYIVFNGLFILDETGCSLNFFLNWHLRLSNWLIQYIWDNFISDLFRKKDIFLLLFLML